MRITLAALCLLASVPAAAQVNKCVVAGKVVYQAAPCKSGTQQAVIQPRSDVSEAAAQANREKFLADDKVRQTNNRRARIDDAITALARVSGHKDLRILHSTYYRETAEDMVSLLD